MALKERDGNCPIQVPINYRKRLSRDEKVRFSVAPEGWSSSSGSESEFVEPTKRKRFGAAEENMRETGQAKLHQ